MNPIYADYNATTPLSPAVEKAILGALAKWGNPSSTHARGREARALLERAREQVGAACGVPPLEVVFTSGGSEANTTALLGSFYGVGAGFRVLSSPLEHSSVRDALHSLARLGAEVKMLPVSSDGSVDLSELESTLDAFRPHLVSLMAANNETGVVTPVDAVAPLCRARGIRFHVDAVQALGKMSADCWNSADLISLSAHKIFGPKGIGALIVRNGVELVATHFGGSQEVKRRGGTENLVGAVGFGVAASELDLALVPSVEALRDRFEHRIRERLDGVSIQGGAVRRTINTSNIRFHGVSAEVLLTALDLEGVCISAGSACSSGSLNPSPVLLAMGFTRAEARECNRLSFSKLTTTAEIDAIVDCVVKHVVRIRERHQAG